MKRVFQTLIILVSAVIALPVYASAADPSSDYPPYICEVGLAAVAHIEDAVSEKQNATDAVKAKGFEYYLDYNFNKFSEGDYIILGYNRTADESKAIRSLGTMFIQRGETAPEKYDADGIEYQLASDTEFNSGTRHKQVYLYYSIDPDAGSPLKELYVEDNYNEPDPDNYPRILVNSFDGGNGELDYLEVFDCEGSLENHCYLYRDYNKDYYDLLKGKNNTDPVGKTVVFEASSTGSVFYENPTVVIVISLAVIILLSGAAAAIIVKRRHRKIGK